MPGRSKTKKAKDWMSRMVTPRNRPYLQMIPISISGLFCGLVGWRAAAESIAFTWQETVWLIGCFMIALSIAYSAHWIVFVFVIRKHYHNLLDYADRLAELSRRYELLCKHSEAEQQQTSHDSEVRYLH